MKSTGITGKADSVWVNSCSIAIDLSCVNVTKKQTNKLIFTPKHENVDFFKLQ